jgi:tetratricopeptide (TPR) repeat protein
VRWKEAEVLSVQVLAMRQKVLGQEHPDTLLSMGNLASLYQYQGQWKKAEVLGVQALEMKRVLGLDHPHTLMALGNLAATYRKQQQWTEAQKLEEELLECQSRVLGKDHPETLATLARLKKCASSHHFSLQHPATQLTHHKSHPTKSK